MIAQKNSCSFRSVGILLKFFSLQWPVATFSANIFPPKDNECVFNTDEIFVPNEIGLINIVSSVAMIVLKSLYFPRWRKKMTIHLLDL